ncbi:MAG: TIGR03086 family protein, partial [Actinobacteria bacterium]|nr:TIGR03086 family protein [Actinomycetota bacterium]
MTTIDDIERAVATFRGQAAGLTAADLERATPCVGWDVRTLIGHVIGFFQAVADALHGERVDLVTAMATVDDVPGRTLDDAATAMTRAWREPGALDRTLATTIRDMPAALASRIVVGDALLHAWDLARARGHELMIPDDLAEAQLALMQQYYDPATRGPGRGFDVAVDCPAGAPVQERLVALSGRNPAWSAAGTSHGR